MFTHSALLWFLPLLAVVVLIHLINMFRHRRVEWAAVEFLLASYKKSRVRILFQQFLLLLLRTLALAAVIFMLAGPKLDGLLADGMAQWLGSRATHHIVLLDDSWSMNDHDAAGAVAFDDALGVLRKIVEGSNNPNDRLSLIRLSQSAAVVAGAEPELAELPLGGEGLRLIDDFLKQAKPSQCSGEPVNLLAAAQTVTQKSEGRLQSAVYFVSDFRRRDWENAAPALKYVDAIREQGGTVRMIRVVNEQRNNVSVENFQAVDGIHAADIDLLVDAGIVNHGPNDAENVNVMLLVAGQTRSNQTIPKLAAGARMSLRFPVRLDSGKPQQLEVQLQPDALPDDNQRRLVLDVPDVIDVLIVTSENNRSEAQYVRVALAPGGTKSGIRTRIEPPSFLSAQPLENFRAILLLDVPPLDSAAARALEEYVTHGGGVAFFLGTHSLGRVTETNVANHRLLPVTPLTEATLDSDFLSPSGDVRVTEHPIFRLFSDGPGPLLGSIRVEKYVAVENIADPAARILATLRNNAPLFVSKDIGQGRSLTVLTTAGPLWNNWARGNPSFVVVMLEMVAWLSRPTQNDSPLLVGQPLNLAFDPGRFEPTLKLATPEATTENTENATTATLEAIVTDHQATATWTRTDQAGFYTAELTEHGGAAIQRAFAVNVDAREGETPLAELDRLSEWFRPHHISLESGAGFSMSFDFTGQNSLGDFLLAIVLLLLCGEIFLAGRILPPVRER